jgi:hypothetical protein
MHRWLSHALVLAAALGPLSGCGSDDTPTSPTVPPTAISDVFPLEGPGTLTRNGAVTHLVTVGGSGTVTATLSSLTPDSTLVIGLSLGTWNGSACSTVIASDRATQGTIITGAATAAGFLCVRVYDSLANVTDPVNYQVTVTHF